MRKIKMTIGIWGNTVLLQIYEMDERFRAQNMADKKIFTASNGFCIYNLKLKP